MPTAHNPHRLLLIGSYQRNPAEGDYRLIGEMFDRLPKETRHTGTLTRFVGFDCALNDRDRLRFFGIEVDDLAGIPAGLFAWELTDKTWTIRQNINHRNCLLWQEDIAWQWLDRGNGPARPVGEFTARGPAAWGGQAAGPDAPVWGFKNQPESAVPQNNEAVPSPHPFWMFANVYFDLSKRGFQDDVVLVAYDPAWPQQFAELAGWLRVQLGADIALRVEHYGSTAIPGLPAKPVIDVLVEVPSFAAAKRRLLPRLNGPTWEYWWYSNHMVFFQRKELMGPRCAHVHIAPRGHPAWQALAFRDYLRTHPADAARYANLKRRLAENHRHDREAYTNAKTEFVNEIISKSAVLSAAATESTKE